MAKESTRTLHSTGIDTRLHYNLEQKQLAFKVREALTTRPDIELKGVGLFNTVAGDFQYRATLKKYVSYVGSAQPAGSTPLRIGGGVAIVNRINEPLLTVSAKKKFAFLEGPNTVLSAKATVDIDPSSKRMNRFGYLRLSHKMFNFTAKQDLKVTVGFDVDQPAGGSQKLYPYLQVRENNWALNRRFNQWHITYDL